MSQRKLNTSSTHRHCLQQLVLSTFTVLYFYLICKSSVNSFLLTLSINLMNFKCSDSGGQGLVWFWGKCVFSDYGFFFLFRHRKYLEIENRNQLLINASHDGYMEFWLLTSAQTGMLSLIWLVTDKLPTSDVPEWFLAVEFYSILSELLINWS